MKLTPTASLPRDPSTDGGRKGRRRRKRGKRERRSGSELLMQRTGFKPLKPT